ncbi:uncharacterized protein LOC114158158 [Xiphophorus couchianus]|uniref:uncharacterized protein LOC114158158 n=1 Tax=Xiphophorus couchianus TaxID=32473 RepID=UPI001016037F|nr:uncharacterized protein LOC114158158 [Xiphophorus couchianus]
MASLPHENQTSSQTPSPASQEENSEDEKLSVALLNINGLRNKTHEIRHIIARDKLHVVALCEIRLNSTVKESDVYIPGFRMWRRDKKDKRNNTGGGVALYVQDHIKTRLRPDLMKAEADEENPKAEIIWVEMELPDSRPVLLGCCYIPKKNQTTYLKHIRETMTLMSKEKEDKDIFLMGDFNIDWLSNSEKKKADVFISSQSWTQIVKAATRLTLDSATCIDHIYTNISGTDSLEVENIPTGCSDHNLITVKVKRKTIQSKGKFRQIQSEKEKFHTDMKKNLEEVYKKPLQEFTKSFLQVADEHAPLKSQNIYCLLKLNKSLEDFVSGRDKEKYKMIKDIYNSMKKKKKLQEKIDNYINGKPQNPAGDKNDATESEETFPFHLPEIEASQEDPQGSVIDPVDGQRNRTRSEVFQETRFTEVKTCLEYVCDHVVKVIDETEAELWELAAGSISATIREILNGYIKIGEIPDKLKKIKSFPFSTDNYYNIRQKSGAVRLHIILSYIFDVILYEQAKPYFIENISIATLQGKLEQLKTDWLSLGEANTAVEAVFLDFTSSFDEISHDLLITKLQKPYFSDSNLKLIESFLSIQKGSSGLPRISCLSQLLHIIIINDLKKNLEPSAVICNNYMMIFGNKSEVDEKMETVRTRAKQFKIVFKETRKQFKLSELSAMSKTLESMIHCHGDKSNWIRAPGNIVKQNGDWENDNVSRELELHFGKDSLQRFQTENQERPAGSAGGSGGSRRREI